VIQQRCEKHAGHEIHVAGLGGEASEHRDRLEVLEGMDQPMAPISLPTGDARALVGAGASV